MSKYFYERIKNLPTAATNSSVPTRLTSQTKSAPKVITVDDIDDDELLASTIKFEQSTEYKKAEEEVKKTRNSQTSTPSIRSFFKPIDSPTKNASSIQNSASAGSTVTNSSYRLKDELQTIVSSSKKRPANDSDEDDDIIPVESTATSVIRPPVKKLPNSKPDFNSFAPQNQTVGDRTKTILTTLRSRRSRGENVALTQIVAQEQLRQREKLMRKPKLTEETKPVVPLKRKASEIASTSTVKKTRTIPKVQKNAFEKLVEEITDTMTDVTLSNATTKNTVTITTSTPQPLVDLTAVQSSTSVTSTVPLQPKSTVNKEIKRKPRKIHDFDDYLVYILKWPVTQLDELELEPNVLAKDFLGENINATPVVELYNSFEEYEEITLPWLFEETFEEIKRSVKLKDHKLAGIEYEAVLPQVRLFNNGLFELKAQILQKRTNNQRREMYSEDDLVVVTFVNQPTNKIFGLIRTAERIIDKSRLHKSFHEHPDVKIKPPVWFCYEYNIRIFGNGMKIIDGSKIKLKAITSLTATLRRFKALASMRSCPLFEHLLSPSLTNPMFEIPTKLECCMEDKYFQAFNESQRTVIAEAVSMMSMTKDEDQAKIYMCQGPPGTGKSQTITGIVRALLQSKLSSTSNDQSPTVSSSVLPKQKTKILICCPSNGGCNEIVRRLIDVFTNKTIKEETSSKLPFKLIRCARGGGVSEDIDNVSLDTLAQKQLEEELNKGGQNETIERNLANKENQKKQLMARIEAERKKPNSQYSEELADLELNLKEITESIAQLQQKSRKTMPETARRQREREIKLQLLRECDICISTLNYAGNSIFDSFSPFEINPQLNKLPNSIGKPTKITSTLFNCLIIDEAGQCIEIDNYIPLRLGINRIILVGDPEQLPATILSRRALDAGLNQSLFERLYKLFKYDLNNPIRMLNIQYRMHEEICKFPSMHIYRSKLKTDKNINQKRKKFLLKPYTVLDVINGQEQLDPISQSYGNVLEAEIVACLVQFIHEKAKVPFNQIGIITPYNCQVKLIEQQLMQRNLIQQQQKIEIGTVDAFQGRQKDVILLSCVRATQVTDSTTAVGIGFVANRQRLNVSLTRAKYAMYILGHMNSLNTNDDWKKLYSNAVERKTLVQLTSPDQFQFLVKKQVDA